MSARRLSLLLTTIVLTALVRNGSPAPEANGLVIYSEADAYPRQTVRELELAGLQTTAKPRQLEPRIERGLHLIVLTPSVLASIDRRAAGRAYADGALLVGLDLSLRDLEALVFGSSSRTERARDEPVFSMLYEETSPAGCGASGSFSDRMANWYVAALVVHRAGEVAFARAGCERD